MHQQQYSANLPPYSQGPITLDAQIPPQGPERIGWYQQREQVVRALEYQANFIPLVFLVSPFICNFVQLGIV